MKKVIAFGSFDILHKGHESYLKEAKSYGDYLVVVVARDKNIVKFKGKKPRNDENYRLEQVNKLEFVDEAVLGQIGNIFDILGEINPDVICLGYDQKTVEIEKLKEELKKREIDAEIIRAKPFKEDVFKSSKL